MKLSSSIVLRPIALTCYLLNTDVGYMSTGTYHFFNQGAGIQAVKSGFAVLPPLTLSVQTLPTGRDLGIDATNSIGIWCYHLVLIFNIHGMNNHNYYQLILEVKKWFLLSERKFRVI